ncbi:Cytidine deaminase [Thalassoglobus neptunius]|uniref:Cytidine deaminase n=1 Tax=Thalassoglobus neptunius TaxID=1938619 RepID=A0A5C5VPQ6_9PLAN|nr:cytidine deaminase [Thalassoglobus neptunius]TWT39791.1 Cytidine deaminase [Thalassoglobus neptunius]
MKSTESEINADLSGEYSALFNAARDARLNAVSTYSGFQVGAAVESETGEIFSGCNIENATFGLTVCAERVAVWKALSEGHRKFRRVLVIADTGTPTPPCGACRQILWEFTGNSEVLLADLEGIRAKYKMLDLMPQPFDGGFFSAPD